MPSFSKSFSYYSTWINGQYLTIDESICIIKASSQSVTRRESGASKVLKKRKRLREPSGYNAFAKEFHSRQIEGEYEVSSIAVLL